jgi:hypothetical protein
MTTMTPEQVQEVKNEMVPQGIPVRFQIDGATVANLTTGQMHRKGINVIHQTVYWSFTKETAKKIAGWIGAKPIFVE